MTEPSTDSSASPESASVPSVEAHFSGMAAPLPASAWLSFLRLASGWAAMAWAVRATLWVLGYRHTVELRAAHGAIRVAREQTLIGRTIRRSDETLSMRALGGVEHRAWFPSLQLYIGSLCFSLGIILGGLFLIDGVRTGETYLLFLGAAFILVGGGLDFLLQLVLPGVRGEQYIDLRTLSGRGLSVRGGSQEEAVLFAASLASEVSQGRK